MSESTIFVGTCSWTDPTILKSGWYPPEASTATQRLAYYAGRFPVVEVDSTYYSLPAERNAVLWVDRTPDHFTFHFKAFSLMTGHGTGLAKLPPTIRDSVAPELGERKRQVYPQDLPEPAQAWIWESFARALDPLREAGKLGFILLQFPPWFGFSRASMRSIERARERLPAHTLAVEFRNGTWLEERNIPNTRALLAAQGMSYVAVDEPQGFRSSVPLAPLVTNPRLAVLRLHGRNAENWQANNVTVAERFRYLYSEDELSELAPTVRLLAEQADQTHVLFNNCYSDYGVRNAEQFAAHMGIEQSQPH